MCNLENSSSFLRKSIFLLFSKACLLVVIYFPLTSWSIVDEDKDGISDVYEDLYLDFDPLSPEAKLRSDGDLDGDQVSNLDESIMGTDPFSGSLTSVPPGRIVKKLQKSTGSFWEVSFFGIKNKQYTLSYSLDLNQWFDVPVPSVIGNDQIETLQVDSEILIEREQKLFFRLNIKDKYSDTDFLNDWEENFLGSNILSEDSDNDGLLDHVEYSNGFDLNLFADSDSDLMSDDWEDFHGLDKNNSHDAQLDFDSDGMSNLLEYQNRTLPKTYDAYSDYDADLYPTIFEVYNGADPFDPESVPGETYLVDSGNISAFQSISSAYEQFLEDGGNFKIIRLAPNTYTESVLFSHHHNLLIIAPQSAYLDGDNSLETGFELDYGNKGSVFLSNLTIRNYTNRALNINRGTLRLYRCNYEQNGNGIRINGYYSGRLVMERCLVRLNRNSAVLNSGGILELKNCTFVGALGGSNVVLSDGADAATYKRTAQTTVTNCIFWNENIPRELSSSSSTNVKLYDCLIRDGLYAADSESGVFSPSNAYISNDGHILPFSEAINKIETANLPLSDLVPDLDGEIPSDGYLDIGVDEFYDSDGDGLPDRLEKLGVVDPSLDNDNDGLSNSDEIISGTNPLLTDEDGDGANDFIEIAIGTNPFINEPNNDADGDGYSNGIEQYWSHDGSDKNDYPQYLSGQSGTGRKYHLVDDDFTVNSDYQYTTIQAAIDAAQSGDVVEVASGSYPESVTINKDDILLITLAQAEVVGDNNRSVGFNIQGNSTIDGFLIRGFTSSAINSSSSNTSLIRNCRLVNNARGVKIRNTNGGTTRFENCLIYGNEGPDPGIYNEAGDAQFINCSIFGNRPVNGNSSACYNVGMRAVTFKRTAHTSFYNCIIWNDAIKPQIYLVSPGNYSAVTVRNCIIRDGDGDGLPDSNATTSSQIWTFDPLLTEDGHLSADSPAIERGTTANYARYDMDREPRLYLLPPSMGADEIPRTNTDITPAWLRLDPQGDPDSDGLNNLGEFLAETNHQDPDSDGDTIGDNFEVIHGLDPNNPLDAWADADGDRYPNIIEHKHNSSASNPQSIPPFQSATTPYAVIVNKNGQEDFTTVQAAIDFVKTQPYGIVWVDPGNWQEDVVLNQESVLLIAGKRNRFTLPLLEDTQLRSIEVNNHSSIDGFIFSNSSATGITVDTTTALQPQFNNNLLINNATAVSILQGSPSFTHCTMVLNTYHLSISNGQSLNMVNSIIDTDNGNLGTIGSNVTINLTSTILPTGQYSGLALNPALASNGRLTRYSPARDIGLSNYGSITDIDGHLRVEAETDVGFDEYNELPTVSAIASPDTGDSPLFIDFEILSSNDPDGNIFEYYWDFENDSVIDATGNTVSHTYPLAGTQTATLYIEDDLAGIGYTQLTLNVENAAPQAAIRVAATEGNPPFSVDFDGTASSDSDGTIVNWEWDFDDDSIFDARGSNPSHVFSSIGYHLITLRVTDNLGKEDSTTITLRVNEAPVAVANFYGIHGMAPDEILFDGSASFDARDSIINYEWDLNNDGVYDTTGVSIQVQESSVMGNTIVLRVTDGFDLTSTRTLVIEDTNANGLIDSWETQWFPLDANISAITDEDDDGVSNADEYRQNTNPASKDASALQLVVFNL